MIARLAAVLGLAVLSSLAVAQPAGRPSERLPRPDLSQMEPAVREHLTEARAAVAELVDADGTDASERAAALGELGRIYLAYEFFDASRAAFDWARELAPEAADWAYYIAVLDEQDGSPDAAAARFLEVLELRPGWLPAELRLARVDLSRGRLEEARARFAAVLERDPDSAAAKYGLAQIATLTGDPQTAVELLLDVTAAQPEATAASYQLGLAYRALGNREKARELLSRQGREPVRFEDPLFESLAGLMRGSSMFVTLASQSRAAGELETAVRAYRLALEQDSELVDARLALADVLVETGDTEGAVVELREVIARNPDDVSGHYNLGTLLGRLGRIDDARTSLERALALDPNHADAHVNLAGLLTSRGEFVAAASHYSEALRIDPRDRESRVQRALLWAQLERGGEALAELEELRVRAPGDSRTVLALGQVLSALGRDGDARETLADLPAGADESARAEAELQMAAIALRRADDDAARGHLTRALEHRPGLVAAHVQLALMEGRQGRFSEAADRYAAALSTAPDDVESRVGRTIALLLSERYVDALAHLEESVSLEEGNLDYQDALARLLATCPDPEVRDGERALAMAQRIVSEAPNFQRAGTVAMALAELGRFEEAATWQQQIVDRASQAGRSDLLPGLRAHLELYRRGEPVRAPWLGR